MTVEGVYKKGGRRVQYLHQTNFFDLVSKPDFEVKTPPTRTLSTFWNQDLLPTALKVRKIYVRGYQDADNKVLTDVWNWVKADEKNKELVLDASGANLAAFKQLPTEVALNHTTAYFFAMHNDFKRDSKTGIFEPFVAWQPDTVDWEKDIRKVTFDFATGLYARPKEVYPNTKDDFRLDPVKDVLLTKVDGNLDIIKRYENMDLITWTVLMKYHLELLRREKYILG